MKIESLQNQKVKEWCKLKEKKYRDETNLFLVEGEHLIQEAEKKELVQEMISMEENERADYYVTKEIMKKLSNQVSVSNRIAVCKKMVEKEISGDILLLDNIQDPGNLGTMIRSAVAFGFKDMILSHDTVDLYNDKVIRASQGMIFHLNIVRKDLSLFLKEIKNEYQIIVTDVKKGENIKKLKKKNPLALIIGNEGQGVSESFKEYASDFVKIEMDENCESLNAGVSASILMYEIRESHNE